MPASPTRPRAPFSSYLLMAATGLAVSGLIAVGAAVGRGEDQLLTALVTAVMTLPASLGLGWVLFVSDHVVQRDARAEDNVENRWFELAAAQTALDAFIVLGLGAGAFALVGDRLELAVSTVLLALTILVGADFALRYAVQRRRALRTAGA